MDSNSPNRAFTFKFPFSLDPSDSGSRRVWDLGRGTGTGCVFMWWHWRSRGAWSAPARVEGAKAVTKAALTWFGGDWDPKVDPSCIPWQKIWVPWVLAFVRMQQTGGDSQGLAFPNHLHLQKKGETEKSAWARAPCCLRASHFPLSMMEGPTCCAGV